MRRTPLYTTLALTSILAIGCQADRATPADDTARTATALTDKYTTVRLTTDMSQLSESERQMLPLLIEAARDMDRAYWKQAFGNGDSLLESLADPELRRFAEINYGPWDRLDGDAPFLEGVGPKPAGANFYPADMTKGEFEAALDATPARVAALKSLYTLVRRDPNGALNTVPYAEAYAEEHGRAAKNLRAAAELAEDPGLKQYLGLRADALERDDYQPSDLAWMDMKNNGIDIVIGPIETYEDQLFGYKAAHEGVVLIKDKAWSERLSRYATMLPALQRQLPVPAEYRRETPGTDSDLNAYDVVYYSGQANAGSKTIAINLPNDEEVQLAKGTRRLQLKNAMQAKFDRILVPITEELFAENQRRHVTFDAFFSNVMFHEVAHGLGIKNTLDGSGTVREALKERASALEEGKADVLGLYMVTKLEEIGELEGKDINDNMVTFMASIFRSIRFGASSAHGRANVAR
ncbi:MAG: Zn-dependent hydrolase, partial [Gemmatimonadales bacterium]|nr:Zn-dependent hydrolase [Gemmatimonadales bacterium]